MTTTPHHWCCSWCKSGLGMHKPSCAVRQNKPKDESKLTLYVEWKGAKYQLGPWPQVKDFDEFLAWNFRDMGFRIDRIGGVLMGKVADHIGFL